jgi:hypothetical protein
VRSQVDGFTGVRSIVSGCAAHESGVGGFGGSGFVLLEGSKARDCIATETQGGGAGFFLGISSEAEGCSSKLNTGSGFEADSAGTMRGCIASDNAGDGFRLTGAQAIECASGINAGDGYVADLGATVRGCKALSNVGSGIVAAQDVLIVDNHCAENTLHGIQTTSTNARVSGNSCQRNTGDNFNLAGSVNSIYSNSASLSLAGVNYNLVTPFNDVAPIGPASTATSPVANISY